MESEFSILLSSIGDGVIITDEQLQIVAFNTIAEELFGRAADAVMGQSLQDILLLHDDQDAEVLFDYEAIISHQHTVEMNGHLFLLHLGVRSREEALQALQADSIDNRPFWAPVTIVATPKYLNRRLD